MTDGHFILSNACNMPMGLKHQPGLHLITCMAPECLEALPHVLAIKGWFPLQQSVCVSINSAKLDASCTVQCSVPYIGTARCLISREGYKVLLHEYRVAASATHSFVAT